MSDTSPDTVAAAAVDRVRAVIGELGEATAAAIGERAGLAYSTTTPKLRTLEDLGHAHRFRAADNRTLWRLTDDGRLAATATGTTDTASGGDPAALEPGSPPTAAAPPDDDIPPPDDDADPPDTTSVDATADATDAADGQDIATAPAPADTDVNGGRVTADTASPTAASDDAAATEPVDTSPARRAKGTLAGAVMDVLEAEPGRAFKVSELCKRIDAANEGTDVRTASPGAVVLAAHRLARAGRAVIATEKPISFQLYHPQ